MKLQNIYKLAKLKEEKASIEETLSQMDVISSKTGVDAYKHLKTSYERRLTELESNIAAFNREGELLISEIELKLHSNKANIEILEQELGVFLELSNKDKSNKAKYKKTISEKEAAIHKVQREIRMRDKEISYIRFLMTQEKSVKRNILKDVGDFISSLISKISLTKKQRLYSVIILLSFFVFIISIVIINRSRITPYEEILPSSYSKLELGMTLDKFHELYGDREFDEDYYDAVAEIKFKLEKESDFKYFNIWELSFTMIGGETRLYKMKASCSSIQSNNTEELCSYAEKVNKILDRSKKLRNHNSMTYEELPDCISYEEYHGELKRKGMAGYYAIVLENDLNKGWSEDALQIKIYAVLNE